VLGSVYFLSAEAGRPETALHAVQVVFAVAAGLTALCLPTSALMVRSGQHAEEAA
jgi:hypothetical protein